MLVKHASKWQVINDGAVIGCVWLNLVFGMEVAFVVEQQFKNRQASSTAGPVNSSRVKLDRNNSIQFNLLHLYRAFNDEHCRKAALHKFRNFYFKSIHKCI